MFFTQQLFFNRFSTPTVNRNIRNVCIDRFLVFYSCFSSSLVRCRDLQSCLVTPVEVLLVG